MVVLDAVVFCEAATISAEPTDRDTFASEIGYVIVCYLVVRCVENSYACSRWKGIPSVLNDVVVDRNVVGYLDRIRPDGGICITDVDTVCSDVKNLALFDRTVCAGPAEPDATYSGMGNFARFKTYVACKIDFDRGGYGCGCLLGCIT